MPGIEVKVGPYESFDRALRRFDRLVSNSGILAEVRRRQFFRPPSVIRKQKKAIKLAKSRINGEKSRRV